MPVDAQPLSRRGAGSLNCLMASASFQREPGGFRAVEVHFVAGVILDMDAVAVVARSVRREQPAHTSKQLAEAQVERTIGV